MSLCRDNLDFGALKTVVRELSVQGDPLEKLLEIVDFELFRPVLDKTLDVSDRSSGGRPPFYAVLKFKMLQAQHGLSFEQTELLVRDRLSWMRFCGLSIADPVPDANTLWDFREALITKSVLDRLFEHLDQAIKDAGICRCQDRLLMQAWLLPPGSETPGMRKMRSKPANRLMRSGLISLRRPPRRIPMLVGR